MKNFFIVVTLVLVVLLTSTALANQEQPAPAPVPATTEEISALRAEIAELRAALVALQIAQPEHRISIGVMPIENAGRIPQVGNAFRQVMVSALNEAGIRAVESLDYETLRWVQRQDQLVRERWIDPISAPPRGELRGVSHYLLGVVTNYSEVEKEDVKVIAGILVVRFGSGRRVRTGSLVVDFRLVDARTGEVVDSFRTESSVRRKERTGHVGGFHAGVGWSHREWPLPETAARAVAQQCAERIAGGFAPTAPPFPPPPKK